MRRLLCVVFVLLCLSALVFSAAAETIINKTPKVGDRFYMGYYEQDNNFKNGREPIEWQVLEVNKKKGTVLVITTKAIECIPYHPFSVSNVKWGKTALRMWLNYYFRYIAFNDAENACIETTLASREADYVTILDKKTLQQKSFNHLIKTGCDFTPYVDVAGIDVGNDNGKGCWWVRTDATSGKSCFVPFVGIHGGVHNNNESWLRNNGVRPAMTLSIEALQQCELTAEYKDMPMTNYAVTTMAIATRSGPSTVYDEIHTYDLDVGYPVNVLRSQETGDVTWVEIEFMYRGKWLRVWTGEKRIMMISENATMKGDYQAYAHGEMNTDTPGTYGPGEKYQQLYSLIEAGTAVEILSNENGWYLIQFNGERIIRTWVPEDAVDLL